jgi:hypothetical protein
MHEMPRSLKANVDTMEHVISQLMNQKDVWLFDDVSKKYFAHNAQIRQESKLLGFDIMNFIKDVQLMAVSTKDNLSRIERSINLREKYMSKLEDNPAMDIKLWKKIYGSFVSDLKYQMETIQKLLGTLKEIGTKTK